MVATKFMPVILGKKYQANPSNSAELIADLFGVHQLYDGCTVSVQSEGGGSLVLRHNPGGGSQYETLAQVGDGLWIFVEGWHYNTSNVADNHIPFYATPLTSIANDLGATSELSTAVVKTVAAAGGGFGVASSVTVNGLSTANFIVDIKPPQPNTNYNATAFLTGSSSLLGALTITNKNAASGLINSADKLSGSQVRVTVQNTGALQLAGAAIIVHVSPA